MPIEYNDITLRLVNPRDKRNADIEQYYINWISINGGVKDWMFTPPNETTERVDSSVIQNDGLFRNLISGASKSIALFAQDLSLDEYSYIKDLFQSNKVELNISTGDVKEIAVTNKTIKKNNDAHVYSIELTIEMRQNNIMKG